jgi:hypothetical protein
MKTQTTYQTQYQPKGGKPFKVTGYVKLLDLTTI